MLQRPPAQVSCCRLKSHSIYAPATPLTSKQHAYNASVPETQMNIPHSIFSTHYYFALFTDLSFTWKLSDHIFWYSLLRHTVFWWKSMENTHISIYTITVPTNAHIHTNISFIHAMNSYMFRPNKRPSSGIENTKAIYIKSINWCYKIIRINAKCNYSHAIWLAETCKIELYV
jgi:hypothetical protein